MFGLHCCQNKISPADDVVARESRQHHSSHRSFDATASPVAAEAGKQEKTTKVTWRIRLFGHPEKKKANQTDVEGKESTVKAEATEPNPKRTRWWFRCCKRNRSVAPAANKDEKKKDERKKEDERNKEEKKNRSCRPPPPAEKDEQQQSHQDEVVPFSPAVEESLLLFEEPAEKHGDLLLRAESPDYNTVMYQAILLSFFEAQNKSTKKRNVGFGDVVSRSTVDRFGFPNIGQSCYMNSSLQSLLTLEDFIGDISRQEPIWSSVPGAQLMRSFMAVRDAHASTDGLRKIRLLRSFKEAVSVLAPEFRDRQQKDAHEFLTTVLEQMRSLAPVLQHKAAEMSRGYTCPVQDHLVFKMENTRTCRSCGAQSKRLEDFTNLSLNLVPGGSVEKMLEDYLMETDLEYKCECGGNASSQRTAFETLPRALILHLKRYIYTPSLELVKVRTPVVLCRELVVSSKEGGGCYSLISVISHFGATGDSGHYVCDGVHPEGRPDEPTDRWLKFNDSSVCETTGATVCEQRKESACILLYKRHV